jgi:site-specific recombinase XerD
MYRGGLRVSEALNLTPRDVDLRRGEIRVNRGKGDRDRVVWVDDTTVEMLAAWQAIRPRSPRFFSTLKGGKLQPSYVRTMTARYGRKAGIGIRVHPHLLRHTMASEALEDGVTIVELQSLLGHQHLETTAIYSHVSNENLRRRLRERAG